jgi:hypothetical protein
MNKLAKLPKPFGEKNLQLVAEIEKLKTDNEALRYVMNE